MNSTNDVKLFARKEPVGVAVGKMCWSSKCTLQTYTEAEGWYEIEREPDLVAGEYLEYDEKAGRIVIKKREKTAEQLEAEKQAAIRQKLTTELSDIILQNKDNPEILAQALCNRAKEIEVEHENGRDPEVP